MTVLPVSMMSIDESRKLLMASETIAMYVCSWTRCGQVRPSRVTTNNEVNGLIHGYMFASAPFL